MARKAIALALVLMALAPVVADAKQKPGHRMTFNFAVLVARDYWAKRDVRVPCAPTARLLTWQDTKDWGYGIAMLADVPACEIEITPWTEPLRQLRDSAWMYCERVVHEVGHLAGLEHEYGGVMAAEPESVPWGCAHPRKFQRRSPYALTRDGFGRR